MAELVGGFLTRLPPRTVSVVKLALRLFEWLPFPRRFSRMGIERRTAFLAKLERSRLGPRRDLLLLAKTLSMVGWARDERVREAVGYEARCAVREGTPEPQVGPLGDLVPAGEGDRLRRRHRRLGCGRRRRRVSCWRNRAWTCWCWSRDRTSIATAIRATRSRACR